MQWYFSYNKIYIIESLPANERKTGRDLNDDSLRYAIMAINDKNREFGVRLTSEYHSISCKEEFVAILSRILEETIHSGICPVIHLEIHGSKSGLHFSNGTDFVNEIGWPELSDILIQINIASGFNLFITLAVCFGGHLIRSMRPMEPPPFWGFVGSIQSVTQGVIAEGFPEFYVQLLSGNTANNALHNLNTIAAKVNVQFSLVNALKVFIYFFRKLYTHGEMEKVVDEVISIQSKKRITALKQRVGKHNIRRYVRNNIYTPELKNRYLQQCLARTFLWDHFPENRTRFNITYEEIMKIREDFHYFW
jgi:hypothetical protein